MREKFEGSGATEDISAEEEVTDASRMTESVEEIEIAALSALPSPEISLSILWQRNSAFTFRGFVA